MFAASNTATRFASFAFAFVMAVAVNGSMLMKFDSVATSATVAQTSQARNVAVLETVTIVGHRS